MASSRATSIACLTIVLATLSATRARDGGGPPTPPPAAEGPLVATAIREGLKPFEAMLGEWEGTLSTPPAAPDQPSRPPLAIVWSNAWSFDGRWLRMEFASREPGPRGSYLEFVGLMTFNPDARRIESIWMNPRIRARAPGDAIDSREMFFESGSFDQAGKVLTLIAPKQNGRDAPVIEVRSTFTIVDQDHFTCVDAEWDAATGEWKPVTRFELTRVR